MEMMLTGTAIQALALQIKSTRAHFKGLAAGRSNALIKKTASPAAIERKVSVLKIAALKAAQAASLPIKASLSS